MLYATSLRYLAAAILIGWLGTTGRPLAGDPAGKLGGEPQTNALVVHIAPGVYYIAARHAAYGRLEVPGWLIGQSEGDIICNIPSNSPQQRWYIAPDFERPGRYTITCDVGRDAYLQPKDDVGPLPLQANGSINEEGRPIWYSPRWATSYQAWIFTRVGRSPNTYTITNDGSGLMMALKQSDPHRVEQSMPSGGLNQEWVMLRIE